MENPVNDVPAVIRSLCQGTPKEQRDAVENYFVPNASFVHPFCRVPSFQTYYLPVVGPVDSRWVVLAIYRWYRFLSPRIELKIESTAFDDTNNILYVSLRQTFALWFVPFYAAHVRLVTVLYLSQRVPHNLQNKEIADYLVNSEPSILKNGVMRYYIEKQEDQYQVTEWLRFLTLDVGALLWKAGQLYGTVLCVCGAVIIFFLQSLWARMGLGRKSKA